MTEPRAGVFSLRDWLQLLVAMMTVTSAAIAVIGWAFLTWTEWKEVPRRLENLEQRVSLIGVDRPEIVAFKGNGVVSEHEVQQGGRIDVAYVLRRTIDCETAVRVRFFDHDANIVSPVGYTMPAVRAPVSSTYSSFVVQVSIPANLPPGRYSYFPEIIPEECGVYGVVVPPMSEAFEVLPIS